MKLVGKTVKLTAPERVLIVMFMDEEILSTLAPEYLSYYDINAAVKKGWVTKIKMGYGRDVVVALTPEGKEMSKRVKAEYHSLQYSQKGEVK